MRPTQERYHHLCTSTAASLPSRLSAALTEHEPGHPFTRIQPIQRNVGVPFSLLSSRSSTLRRKCASAVAAVVARTNSSQMRRRAVAPSPLLNSHAAGISRSNALSGFDMKPKQAQHYADTPFVPWLPLSRQHHPNYYRHNDSMDWQNFNKTQSSLGSTYSDFSGNSAIGNKGRDYYFLSPHYRNPVPNLNHTELYLGRDRRRQLRQPDPAAPAPCPCNRSRSMEDMRTDIVTEWEDDDENGNRIVAPVTQFKRPPYRFNSGFSKHNHLSMENLVETAPHVPSPKRVPAFQVTFKSTSRCIIAMRHFL